MKDEKFSPSSKRIRLALSKWMKVSPPDYLSVYLSLSLSLSLSLFLSLFLPLVLLLSFYAFFCTCSFFLSISRVFLVTCLFFFVSVCSPYTSIVTYMCSRRTCAGQFGCLVFYFFFCIFEVQNCFIPIINLRKNEFSKIFFPLKVKHFF